MQKSLQFYFILLKCIEGKTKFEILKIHRHQAIYRVQQYCWPHVLRSNSLILVNGERSGKTFAYLPAICSLIQLDNENNEADENEKGPTAIILVSTRAAAEQMQKYCRYFTKDIAYCSDKKNGPEALASLLKPVDILISTANGIKALEEKNKKYHWFSKNRLKHFIIENIDTWDADKLQILSQTMDKLGMKKIENKQIIVTSRIWVPFILSFLKLASFNNPLICIGAQIEAAVYANTQFILKIVKNDAKVNAVFEFLQNNFYEDEKTIILCNSDDDVDILVEKLKGASVNVSFCSSKSSFEEINAAKANWDSRTSVLVCADTILADMNVRDAQNLIHYTLGSSWTQTCYRFSVLLGYHENRLIFNNKVQVLSEAAKPFAKSLILLDENNEEQLPKLIKFLDRNKIVIDETIRRLIRRIEMNRESNSSMCARQICTKFLEFGKYHNNAQCKNRHVLTDKDKAFDDLPIDGEVKFQIISIESPTLYNVRLLEHRVSNSNLWHFVKQSDSYASFFMKFNMFFSNTKNHQTYYPIVKDEVCVAIDKGEYYRCKIMEVNKIEYRGVSDHNVRAKLVDIGPIMTFKSSQLLILPKQFAEYPFQFVELRLLGIIPYDKEDTWDKKAISTVQHWFEKYPNQKKIVYTAQIEFALMNTLFVREISIKEELPALRTFVDKINIKRNLIAEALVQRDSEIENDLKLMAFELGLLNASTSVENIESSPETSSNTLDNSLDEEKKFAKSSPQIVNNKATKNSINERKISAEKESWSILTENKFSKVKITSFLSPAIFFVQLENSRLAKLSAKIDEYIKNGAECIKDPAIGQNCLAKYDDSYMRGKIIGMASENFKFRLSVFFVDFGKIKKLGFEEVLSTNEDIIKFLPYQAIQCGLVGISSKSLNERWNNDEIQYILKKFIAPHTSFFVRPMQEEAAKKTCILKSVIYKVILVAPGDEDFATSINLTLYNEGLATKDPDTEHYMDLSDTIQMHENAQSDECSDSDSNLSDEWEEEADCKDFVYKEKDNTSEKEFEFNFDDSDLDDLMKSFGLPKPPKILPSEQSVKKETPKEIEVQKLPDVKADSPNEKEQNDQTIKPTQTPVSKYAEKLKKKSKKFFQHLRAKESSDILHKTSVPNLKNIHKTPRVEWRQSEDLICLHVSAPNIEDYDLKVTQTNLVLSFEMDNEMYVLCLNLFGSIDSVSHEIRGLFIKVSLKKAIKGKAVCWPRLTKETDRHLWLKYNHESLLKENDSKDHFAFPNAVNHNGDDDSLTSSDDDYEDGIVDEIYDPLAEF